MAKYPSDLSDEQMKIVLEIIKSKIGNGLAQKYRIEDKVNAIFYQLRSGCQWRMLPQDIHPKWKTIYNYKRILEKRGIWNEILNKISPELRKQRNKSEDIDTIIIDSTTLKTDGYFEVTGINGDKKIKGAKVHLAVDDCFSFIDILITAANAHDGISGISLIDSIIKKNLKSKLSSLIQVIKDSLKNML
jgi:transposase